MPCTVVAMDKSTLLVPTARTACMLNYTARVANRYNEMLTTLAAISTVTGAYTVLQNVLCLSTDNATALQARGTMEKYLHDYDALFGRTQKLTEDLEEQMRRNALLVTESGKAVSTHTCILLHTTTLCS
jgi:hypothetical protein